MALLDYDGASLSQPANAGKAFRKYGVDQRGTVEYRFNANGYRSDDYRPEAQVHIFAVGCSHTYGLGVELSESWPSVFAETLAARRGLKTDDVNVVNFSSVGASNRYIMRTLLRQCEQIKPDIAVIGMTHASRMENYFDGRGFNVLPAILRSPNLAVFSNGENEPDLFQRLRKDAKAYYQFYSDEFGAMELAMNALLIQNYCQSRQIDYVMVFTQTPRSIEPAASLMKLLDSSRTLVVDKSMVVDSVLDHAGPETNRRIGMAAASLFERASSK